MKIFALLTITFLFGCCGSNKVTQRGPEGQRLDSIMRDHIPLRFLNVPTINLSEDNTPAFWTAEASQTPNQAKRGTETFRFRSHHARSTFDLKCVMG